jgi:ketosteroid isomerase-like protein
MRIRDVAIGRPQHASIILAAAAFKHALQIAACSPRPLRPGSERHTRLRHQEGRTMTAENEVLAASRQFYAALNSVVNGDAGPMGAICSQGADATTMHPIGGRQVGWDQVSESWRQVAVIASAGKVTLADQLIRTIGDVACELGTEHAVMTLAGRPVRAEVRVTNIYRRESGAWKLVHHHSDASPEMQGAAAAGPS